MMGQPLRRLRAVAAPMLDANIDTDQILPKQFLATLERSGLGDALFYDARFTEDGVPRSDFILNRLAYAGAGILIAGANFGCGSSREHAAWALRDFGIRCIIAPSFGDILFGNCLNNGIAPIVLGARDVAALAAEANGAEFALDLEAQTIRAPSGALVRFALEPAHRRKLLDGVDDIDLTLARLAEIEAFEAARLDKFE